ncbi:MAG: MltA domain-containing protein [Sedimentisphaerales bacterium]|nr:MltA domain-containing protein [Sedimentisphaerales bacterium]
MDRRKDSFSMAGKILFVVGILVIGLAGCQKAEEEGLDYSRQLPPGQLALRKITDPAQIPSMTIACLEVDRMREAIDNSLSYLSKPSSEQFFPYGEITHDHAVNSLESFANLLDQGLRGRELETRIRELFDVYISIGCDSQGTVLYTGYYTPIFDGSLKPTTQFRFPLYKKPDDLVKSDTGEILGRLQPGGGYIPYPSRAELQDSGELKGLELVWLGHPFEVYIAHVQGSAKIRLPDGNLITVGYAANNGHEYRSAAVELVRAGKISEQELNLNRMIDYFKAHPDEVDQYTRLNPRFVFFRFEEGDPRGSLNEPVIAYRSIATDKEIYPRACLAFLDTSLPRMIAGQSMVRRYTGFTLDQDTGGAIRAPGRCDVYMGVGNEAGQLAGQIYTEGQLYYLFLKSHVMQ